MGENPWIRKNTGKKNNHGRKAEVKTSRRLKGKLHAGSGNMGVKADFTVKDYKVENKATIHRSIKLELDWLLKVSQEAIEVGKIPALSIQFVNSQGTPLNKGRWVMIPEDEFKDLIENKQE